MWRKSVSRRYICLMGRSVGLEEFWGSCAGRPCSSQASPSGRINARQAADIWRKCFEANGVTEPDLSCQYIIAHVLGAKTIEGVKRERLSAFLTEEETQRIWKLCEKRLSRMPVQYVIEEWDFRDVTLKMRPPVFIPRPETEELVELVLTDLQRKPGSPTCLEVGCGSGAISLSLLKNLPQLRAIALDQSGQAVELTRENALRLGLQDRLKVFHVDVTKDAETVLKLCSNVSALVSNPPYLFSEDLSSLEPEILRFEDHAALDGGNDGMKVIHKILTLAPQILSDDGCVYLEVDPRHPQLILQWMEANVEWLRLAETRHDISSRPRFCILRKDKSNDHKLHLG
ncbi:MTRF1L release factor glutamine methyltransferase isoform X2 [Phyllopteryx taeniolatus]|uniref:MTRF1L release factor glutamine methyltransferase isoform X2 n=1 Tax=Phyllopteryx taeniolatus TaxID=161469 RepID=UPI002AD29981|nr:MTRF1L release factor glutamine methyltransferase isoform X2 [Phyllopteryx taeniolatus]